MKTMSGVPRDTQAPPSGITSPAVALSSQFPEQGDLAARGMHLGQPLLHGTEVTVQPPGSAELGQTVLLVGRQGALRDVQRVEGYLQGGHSVEQKRGAHVPEPQPCPC